MQGMVGSRGTGGREGTLVSMDRVTTIAVEEAR